MIISHRYKYVFVQNARTASTSIGKELCERYGGEKILSKHSPYSNFLKQASDEEKEYFAFTGQRNPLDALATLFFRAKYQKLERYNNSPDGQMWEDPDKKRQLKRWLYISENDLSFEQYFKRYFSCTTDRSYLKIERERMDFVYRYENLQRDFSTVLDKIGLVQVRELPQHSQKTPKKDSNFYQYYTPGIQRRVQLVFGRSFKEMGYDFPSQWPKPTLADHLMFLKDCMFKRTAYP